MQVLYVLGDAGYPQFSKVGYDSEWPTRYQQALSHNPRGITVSGLWKFRTKPELREAERRAKQTLAGFKRTVCHGAEWFDLSGDDVHRALVHAGVVEGEGLPRTAPRLPSRDLPYDDWRKISDDYKGQVYRRLLWVFREETPQNRIKVIHSPLYDTCYRYAFTYNPFPVFLAAAYRHPAVADGPTPVLRKGNERVMQVWEKIVQDPSFGPGIAARNVGWLAEGTTEQRVEEVARDAGLESYDLGQAKPRDVRPRDSQVSPIAPGAIPPMRRVMERNKGG
ncbi:MAG: hypothetical protein P1P84_23995 [Deferrisomatales bacterium]|nr:hypothetical protein [Deferrisomatales bacterium]